MNRRRLDMFSVDERSAIMRAVKGSGTRAEVKAEAALRRLRFRYRRHAADLLGKPDFVLDRWRTAIFVDGDFWHGRPWHERGAAPVANRAYWIAKFERNWLRDRQMTARLRRAGWCVIRIWESDINGDPSAVERALRARLLRRKREIAQRGRR